MKVQRTTGFVAIFLSAAAVAACHRTSDSPAKEGGGASDRVRVAFVSNNAAEFWTIAEAGTAKAAEDFGVEVLFRRPKSPTAAAQKEIIEDLLSQGVKGIAISVIDPVNQEDYLNEIAGQVTLITQDNDAPKSRRKCYIGTDNYEAGKAVGKLVKEVMPDGGTIGIFVGQPDPINAQQRRQGVLDELAGQTNAAGPQKYGKYTLHGTRYDNVDQNKAKDNAADMLAQLQGDPRVCLIGLWAYNPPAIRSAVEDAKKQGVVKIVGFDEDDQTLEGIKKGSIYGTIVQQPFEFGYQSVKLMNTLAKDPKAPLPAGVKDGVLHVPYLVIKKDNVDEFQQKLAAQLNAGQKAAK